mmetsp:Transcript_81830/g.207921  ORF Transcript_81830/g.207921 Transcript_81830/m.207921 type:complete len:227 (+) Transcript_81830:107-787(+)|eukprot:CAMPEP_0183580746 /NCGR_PEP_ID=MMETSP0371-20130417/146291_1 /TAXON_ID=268820 /ORGANISM="Peridinium aciculiferum, Strain PAER-2" /LENGTH=226 /DNA_ID=CAMNT_0025791357 /DNA_START=26 /DNA_END=706 /DNA_ORIENTATION=+
METPTMPTSQACRYSHDCACAEAMAVVQGTRLSGDSAGDPFESERPACKVKHGKRVWKGVEELIDDVNDIMEAIESSPKATSFTWSEGESPQGDRPPQEANSQQAPQRMARRKDGAKVSASQFMTAPTHETKSLLDIWEVDEWVKTTMGAKKKDTSSLNRRWWRSEGAIQDSSDDDAAAATAGYPSDAVPPSPKSPQSALGAQGGAAYRPWSGPVHQFKPKMRSTR